MLAGDHTVAGTVTTGHAVTAGVHELLRGLGLWERARRDPEDSAHRVLEEALRRSSPHRGLVRVTTRACTLGGLDLPAGARVLPVLGAAGRDSAHAPDPTRFDPERAGARPHGHRAFGAGPHACVGARLARLEGQVALRELMAHLPDLAPTGTPPQRPPNLFFHGLATLPVRCAAREP